MSTDHEAHEWDVTDLRDPAVLMQPERLGSLKQNRLSFARLLVDKMVREEWEIEATEVSVDEDGTGRAIYTIETPNQVLSFVVFSEFTDEHSARIIADAWDLRAFLCEGRPSEEFIQDQYEELPHVLTGRARPEVLVWTRANRSMRFFEHIVDSLAEGHQPDIDYLAEGGYLMRSSGYYGNGLNGTKVFRALDEDHPLSGPYSAQMFAVYMLRVFGYDLAEQMAAERNTDAATLDRDIKRYLGTGNSSGIGIIEHVISHPQFINAWVRAREVALARAKTIDPTESDIERFEQVVEKARQWYVEDDSDTHHFFASKDLIAEELAQVTEQVDALAGVDRAEPLWTRLCEWAGTTLEVETQEVLHSLLLDVHPEVCEGLDETLTVSERSDVQPNASLATLHSLVTENYEWALDVDFSDPSAEEYFWYRSIESEEPRLGVRDEHEYEEYERPIDIARQVQRLVADLEAADDTDTVASFIFEHPEHRAIVERIQTVHGLPYAEVRDNPLDADVVPLHYISCLKAIWGIGRAHPKSKGWVRGTFFQGAPLPEDLRDGDDSYWVYPAKPEPAAVWRDQ
ncbi:hypothetical protein VB773_19370 [Haloarculaceae archaeon H-GB2-1]|nr:hypothetical protein [Haloarculaceae archaeon H-GB1-1]MEA5409520.1 hypothetical protein [Haloarculaceae archaeon H-GB2-1]